MKRRIKIRRHMLFIIITLTFIFIVLQSGIFQKHFKTFVENEEFIQTDSNIKKEILKKNLENCSLVRENINKDVEIVILNEKGNFTIFHDKTFDKNEYIKWLIYSNINLKLYYNANIIIASKDIDITFNSDEEQIYISYDTNKFRIGNIDIYDILLQDSTGIIGKKYSPEEVTALILVSKEEIENYLKNDNTVFSLAESNLDRYIYDMCKNVGVDNVKIIKK